jgi:TetR/AcrR family transcriptional regulator, mexJK operon transcriptional repressor
VISVHNAELSARMFIGPLLTYMFTDGLLQVGEPRVPERAIIEQHVELFLKTVTP